MKKTIANIAVLILLIFCAFGCVRDYVKSEPRQGYYYVVRPDETLSSIARDHRMSVEELAEVNELDKSAALKEGKVLFVPREESVKNLS